jgi:gamma-glutamylputrescine oxidase
MRVSPPAPFREWAQAPRSLWQVRHASIAEAAASVQVPTRVRHGIIGAGMTGLATALELVQAGVPADDIIVLDAMGPAIGATGRNAGFVLSFPGTEILDWQRAFGDKGVDELCRLNRANRDLVIAFATNWNALHPDEAILLQRGGSFFLAASEDEARDLDISMEVVSRGAPEEYEIGPPQGALAAPHYTRALIGRRDAGIDPAAYALALAASSGVQIVSGPQGVIAQLEVRHDGVHLTFADGRELTAENVFVAINGYAQALLGAEWPVMPVRNQVMAVRCDDFDLLAEWGEAVYYANHGYDYWRVLPDGTLVVGGGRNRAPGREENIMAFGVQPESRAYLHDVLVPRLTNGAPFTVEREWSGVMGYSPDGIPMLGAVPDTDERVWFAGGFTGYGLGFHRVVAQGAARCLLGEGTPGIFDASRLVPTAKG